MDRRRQYYIDKKFQKRFLSLFGFIAVIIAVTNFFYYQFNILNKIERMIFKSHFVFENLIDYFENEFISFSLWNTFFITVIVFLVYTYFRLRIKRFFRIFENLLGVLIKEKDVSKNRIMKVPDEFEGISESIKLFSQTIIDNKNKQKKLISDAEKILKR